METIFTVEELEYLLTILEMHLEGMQDTQNAMIEDRATLSKFDDFIETLGQHGRDTVITKTLQAKVENTLALYSNVETG